LPGKQAQEENMLYKPDFETIIPRMTAWWKGEILDRACIAVYTGNGKKKREIPKPATMHEIWTNHEYRIDLVEADMEVTYFAGEAMPVYHPNLGPDLFAGLMGGKIEFREETSWVAPFLDWDKPVPFKLNKKSFEWQWFMKMYKLLAERSKGKYMVSAPDCHSGGDSLLAMRGGTNLCMDLYDRPDQVKSAMKKLEKGVVEFHEGFWKPIEANGQKGHGTSWMHMWSPGRSNVIQLDLLALISPDMFREFFLSELMVQCKALDNTLFHLDGPDAIKHLPILYEVPMPAIQWVYGAGHGPMVKWIPLLKEIQANGKGLHLGCEAKEVETLLKELSSKGLFLATWADDEQQADDLLKLAAKLTHE
jgi:hypothetical protein